MDMTFRAETGLRFPWYEKPSRIPDLLLFVLYILRLKPFKIKEVEILSGREEKVFR
jgi:hypothetical protein